MNFYIEKPSNSILSDSLFNGSDLLKTISDITELDSLPHTLSTKTSNDPSQNNHGDPVNEYNLNLLGYRSIEFKKVSLITAGCSVTYGMGVPLEETWSSIFSKKLNKKNVNLAAPGWSSEAIVDNLFKYFYKYGNPKIVAVLFPDYNRLIYTSHENYATAVDHHEVDAENKIRVVNISMSPIRLEEREKYSKAPHDMRKLIIPEYGVLRSFRAINSLISYCKNVYIKLVWSTWSPEMDSLILQAKAKWNSKAYSGYVSSATDDQVYGDCHSNYKKKYGKNFERGYDGLVVNSDVYHPGIHYHLHTAENFYKKLKEIL